MNYDIWTRMRERALGTTSFEDGFAWAPVRVDLSDGGEMQPADALFTSGGFFTTLGVPALLGRTFTPADDQQGGGPEGVVAVISYRVWQRRFNGAADVIGTALPVDGVRCTVIGVMPPAFFGIEVGQPFDVALPLAVEPIVRGARASLHHPSRADVDRHVQARARTVGGRRRRQRCARCSRTFSGSPAPRRGSCRRC